MFIITKEFSVELKDICKVSKYCKDDTSEANSRYTSIMEKAYNYGSTERAERSARKTYNEYLSGCEQEYSLEINDTYVVKCTSKDTMNSIYDKIVKCLKEKYSVVEITKEDGVVE